MPLSLAAELLWCAYLTRTDCACYTSHTQITVKSCNKVMHIILIMQNQLYYSFPLFPIVLCTCPESQAQHCLVHGVFETEVWNDLEVVGSMKCICCNRAIKGEISGSISGRFKDISDSICGEVKEKSLNTSTMFAVQLQAFK